MEIYIVFEYAEHTNKIVGCYKNEEDANRKHDESPTWRYIEKQKLLWNRNSIWENGGTIWKINTILEIK